MELAGAQSKKASILMMAVKRWDLERGSGQKTREVGRPGIDGGALSPRSLLRFSQVDSGR